ncbi:MAG TPA: cytidylate kinase, partial [Flavobacteriales bacterium]|nr:cytidylate kinase [Flavobacteriales bacterium]
AQVRASRRVDQLKESNPDVRFEDVLHNLIERDRIDSNRAVSPLRQADDAIVLDNSQLTHEEQFQFLLVHARKAMAGE